MKGKRSILALSVIIALFLGVFAASGAYTFVSAHGTSYLSNDPAVCVNCHIMREQYDGWVHGSHHAAATCNDCHLPHENVFAKYLVKASNGYHHSKAFTLMNFEEPIRIKPGNAQVLESNCIRCHADMVNELTAHGTERSSGGTARSLRSLFVPPHPHATPGQSPDTASGGVPTDPTQKADLYGCVRCHGDVGHGARR